MGGSREYVNMWEAAVNVALRYVGLADTADYLGSRKVKTTTWHEFTASGVLGEMYMEGVVDERVKNVKKAFPRCKVGDNGIGEMASGDKYWFVRFKLNEQTLSKLPV